MKDCGLQVLRDAILAWHDENARDLPWCGERDPYRVWVSEIMLQQTRVEAAIPYYQAFLHAFGDVRALAEAPQDQVLKQWEGLGYYTRARNLHKAAQVVAFERSGRFPETAREWRTLPGIGEYTAGAIASIAFGQPEPAVDGNQIRVLTRIFEIEGEVSRPDVKRAIRERAQALLDPDRPGDFNQALMGMGALVCLPARPRCGACPAQTHCAALRAGRIHELPELPVKIRRKTCRYACLLLFVEGRVAVRRREDAGLLAGLWEFPLWEGVASRSEMLKTLNSQGIRVQQLRKDEAAEHEFTHLIWKLQSWICLGNVNRLPADWVLADEKTLRELAMPSAMRAFRQRALSLLTCRESSSVAQQVFRDGGREG